MRYLNAVRRSPALKLSLLLAATALAAPFAGGAPAWAKVGVTSTANGGPIGQPPQQPQHTLTVGVDVFANERITTGANDQAHLLFLDGSALTIGPNSEIILDKFVYDADKETGTLALTVGKGIFRLVGGKITKNDGAATVRVGSATIGIRGGIVIIDAQKPQEIDTYFMFGDKLTVATPLGTETALRPGSAISLKKGQPPSSPHLIGPDSMTGLLSQLEGRLGGGARISTVTSGAINTGVSSFSSVNNEDNSGTKNKGGDSGTNTITPITDNDLTTPTGVVADGRLVRNQPYTSFNPTTLAAPRDPANNSLITTVDINSNTLTVGALNGAHLTVPFLPGGIVAVTSANSSSTYGPLSGTGYVSGDSSFYAYVLGEVNNNYNTIAFVGGQPTATANFPISGFGQHTMVALGSNAPFLPENVSSPAIANAYYSPLYSAYSPNITSATAALSPQRAVWFQASLGISGSGAAQSSFFSLSVGGYFTDETKKNSLYAAGTTQSYLRSSADAPSQLFRSSLSTLETANGSTIYGATGQNMAFGPEAVTSESGTTVRTPQAALDQPLTDPTGTGYYFLTAAVEGNVQATTPNTRNGGTFKGYAAGLTDTRTLGNQITVGVLANEDPNKVSITTSPTTNRVSAKFELHDVSQGGTGGTTLNFGSISGTYGQSSAYVDDKTFAATQSPTSASFYSDGSSTNTIISNVAMVSGGAVNNQLFAAAGVTPCTCTYLTWGYWAADLTYTSGSRAGEQDRVQLGTWVAGTLPGTNEIPTGNINASYTGHMMGNVSNNGSTYVAVGDYSQTWNFQQRSGTATINNFDGAAFSTPVGAAQTNPRDFFGGSTSTNTTRTISLNGSFFKGGSDPVQAVGGNFRIGGTNYLAVGSFAASK